VTGRQGVDYIERKHGVQMLGEAPWIVVIGLGSEPIAGTGETNGSRATAI
jgi:hypothetical protein